MNPYANRTQDKMKDVLKNQGIEGPTIHYYMVRGGENKTNITVIETGCVGDEYIKTYGHYHVGTLEETYKVIQGVGIILLQERELDSSGKPIDDEIKSFKAIKVKVGDKVHIPKNTGHLAVNTGDTWFVLSDDSPVNFNEANPVSMPGHADYEPFKKLHGAAYYVVNIDSKPALIKNNNYKKVPVAKIK